MFSFLCLSIDIGQSCSEMILDRHYDNYHYYFKNYYYQDYHRLHPPKKSKQQSWAEIRGLAQSPPKWTLRGTKQIHQKIEHCPTDKSTRQTFEHSPTKISDQLPTRMRPFS